MEFQETPVRVEFGGVWPNSNLKFGETLLPNQALQAFPRIVVAKAIECVLEGTRETGMVIVNSLALVETLMDATRWQDMFPCMIARAATTDIISSRVAGTRNGAIHLMHAELQVLSPLVPTQDVSFLRFCKQLAEGAWAMVDLSIDIGLENLSGTKTTMKCRRLPSGFVVQDMPNGYSELRYFPETSMPPNVAPSMPMYPYGAPRLGQQLFYCQAPPALIPQQQLVPGMRPGGAPMPNFFVPMMQQGQQPQRPGGRRAGGGPMQ